jgi:hypothetical protein
VIVGRLGVGGRDELVLGPVEHEQRLGTGPKLAQGTEDG